MNRSIAWLLPALAVAAPVSAQAPWRDVTPRAGLAGWHTAGGGARYTVEGDELVGRAMPGPENSWLVSDALYGDFIIEFEAKTDAALNSGVMIRGQSRPDYRRGAVHGYQVEIDPSTRKWSAGIYDEQRRQWLYTLGRNEAARQAYRAGGWNTYRVEAIGGRLRTFINGVPAADLADDVDARGFVAFQVHAVADDVAQRGAEVRFRKVRIITDAPARHALPANALPQESWLANRLTAEETRAGWRLLWDGRTGAGWRGVQGWTMRDGVLTSGSGDVATARLYRDFELSVDFRLTPGAESGIVYRGGAEYQLIDDEQLQGGELGPEGKRALASLKGVIVAENLSDRDSPGKRVNSPGDWNRAVIVVRGERVEHWLNGFKVVDYARGTPAFAALKPEGPIVLQGGGTKVDFRSIKLRPIGWTK